MQELRSKRSTTIFSTEEDLDVSNSKILHHKKIERVEDGWLIYRFKDENPMFLPESKVKILNDDGSVKHPFIDEEGITLYETDDNHNSILEDNTLKTYKLRNESIFYF